MDKSIYTAEQQALSTLLRDLRMQAGLRQIDVAAQLQVVQSFVSKYESGERRLDLPELRQVCAALGVSVTDLIHQLDERLRSKG